MENFFYNDDFYNDVDSFIHENFEGLDEILGLEDDKQFHCTGSVLQPIITLSSYWITDRIDDDRFSENGVDEECIKINKILDENIDYDKINSLLPKLYYENRKDKFTITKQDLLDRL